MTSRQDWVRTAAYVALIVATVVLSYATLRDRALHSGFPAWAAWLYPPAVDATIIVASRTWRDATLSPKTRGLAAVVTLAAIVAGVAAFVVEHASAGPVAVAFSAVVPLALASALVLTSWSATDRRDAALIAARAADEQQAVEDAARAEAELAQRQERHEHTRQERELVASLASVLAIGARYTGRGGPARQVPTPVRRQAVAPARRPTAKPALDLDELVDRARPLMPLGRGSLARRLGCTEDKARKIIAALDRERQRPVALLREA